MIKNNNGFIFDIQRASFVDGPGLRTVIFFKGCNLNCQWCHNPEGIKSCKQLLFYEDKCTKCGKCFNVCPNYFKSCSLCGKCVDVCKNEARILCGKYYSVEDLTKIIEKDKVFYQSTGGGVTLSGGECLLQIDFIKELLIKLKEDNIHTAIDTAGCVDFQNFDKIINYTDLFLYDVKLFTNDLHKNHKVN